MTFILACPDPKEPQPSKGRELTEDECTDTAGPEADAAICTEEECDWM